jgi:hypothetical protein
MWFKVDDMFWAHPKTIGLAPDAITLWLRAGCWSVQHLTDGFIPTHAVRMLTSTDAVFEMADSDGYEMVQAMLIPADALCGSGLWQEVPGGYQFHDWGHYQPSGADVKRARAAKSAVRAEAGRKGAARRWQTDGKADGKRDSKPMRSHRQTDGPEPEPEPEEGSRTLARLGAERDPGFAAFWASYPRKAGKRTAAAAYDRAVKRASAQQILDGLQQQIPAWTDPQFIPHPTTWLNRDGWLDDPAPPAGSTAPLHGLAAQVDRYQQGTRFFA